MLLGAILHNRWRTTPIERSPKQMCCVESFPASPQLGYALNIGVNTNEVASFAALVFDLRGKAEAAIAVSIPRHETDAGHIGQLVAEAARRASCTPGIEH
ncbi:IclR family transcriptional regulator domain-containing protein [Rhodococcus erythropolis]|uniref:IclR family transcriptional regulator domain-containing protein n=1 Tax=Rhodococcus erythropolis TaxID=1833 RepID=UPI00301342B0